MDRVIARVEGDSNLATVASGGDDDGPKRNDAGAWLSRRCVFYKDICY
ncbi:MAG: hypothetical protein U1G07_05975 [Verrucomicrobiota bacterium]